jgi:hypothetical protein
MLKTDSVKNEKSIHLLDRFTIDKKLPKYASKPQKIPARKAADILVNSPEYQALPHDARWMMLERIASDEAQEFEMELEDRGLISSPLDFFNPKKKSLWSKIKDALTGAKEKLEEESVLEVFNRVKVGMKELNEWIDRKKELDNQIDLAAAAGQEHLAKKLIAERTVRNYENALFLAGYKKFASEQDLLDFSKKCEKGLSIDWMADFARPIPASVIENKKKADELMVFDNYSILHFDPKGSAVDPKSVEKRKDPILFGMIKGSRNFYFIDDWEDEHCKLTFDQIVKTLGRDSMELS